MTIHNIKNTAGFLAAMSKISHEMQTKQFITNDKKAADIKNVGMPIVVVKSINEIITEGNYDAHAWLYENTVHIGIISFDTVIDAKTLGSVSRELGDFHLMPLTKKDLQFN